MVISILGKGALLTVDSVHNVAMLTRVLTDTGERRWCPVGKGKYKPEPSYLMGEKE